MKRLCTILIIGLLLPTCTLWAAGFGTVRMGVVLPLKDKTNRGAKMVEFYQGILMAVDSMRHEGLSIEVKALHSGSTAAEMDALLASNSLANCHVVFGPLDAAQLPALADYCDIHHVRLVVPFSTSSAQVAGHPMYYQANETQPDVQSAASDLLTRVFANGNYVFADTGDDSAEGNAFVARLKDQLANKGMEGRPLPVAADGSAYENVLSATSPNVVVLNSPSLRAVNVLLPQLEEYQRQHPGSSISLIGYPDWQTYTSQHLADFHKYNTYIYSTFYRNPLEERINNFERLYMRWFGHPMIQTYPRYCMMGFDMAYYFLRGLQIYGNELEQRHADVPNYPLQHNMRFERLDENSGFVNRHVQLIHYTPQQTIEFITSNP